MIAMVEGGAGMTEYDDPVVDASLATIHKRMQTYANKCLTGERWGSQMTQYAGVRPVLSGTAYSSVEMKGNTGMLTFQFEYAQKGVGASFPENGMYMLAANYTAVDKNKTKFNVYGMARHKLVDITVNWAKGEKAKCPKIG